MSVFESVKALRDAYGQLDGRALIEAVDQKILVIHAPLRRLAVWLRSFHRRRTLRKHSERREAPFLD